MKIKEKIAQLLLTAALSLGVKLFVPSTPLERLESINDDYDDIHMFI